MIQNSQRGRRKESEKRAERVHFEKGGCSMLFEA